MHIFFKEFNKNLKYPLIPAVLILVFLFWEFLLRTFSIPSFILPSPFKIIQTFLTEFKKVLLPHTFITLQEILAGFFIGAPLGTILGIIISQSRLVEEVLAPYILAIQTTPKIALAPVFVIWFGFGITSKIVIVTLIVFFPVMMNAIAGFTNVEELRLELMHSLAATRWQIFRKLRFPNSIPFIFAGLKVSIVLGVIGAVAAEFVGAKEGLGYLVLYTGSVLENELMFAAILMLAIIGIVLYHLLWLVESYVINHYFK